MGAGGKKNGLPFKIMTYPNVANLYGVGTKRGNEAVRNHPDHYMLATILKSKSALNVTCATIETFTQMRNLKRELVGLHKETDIKKTDNENAALWQSVY